MGFYGNETSKDLANMGHFFENKSKAYSIDTASLSLLRLWRYTLVIRAVLARPDKKSNKQNGLG